LRDFKREWPPGKTVDILVQKKVDKTAPAPSGDGIFQGPPSGLKNPAILFSYQDKKNQKRTVKKRHQKIVRYPFMQFLLISLKSPVSLLLHWWNLDSFQ
jgi:hypothetical protein